MVFGKASADNMGDLMKLSMAFDFKKVAAAYAAGGAADVDVVTEVFSYFPKGFKEGAAAGWTANLQWVVNGGTDQTIKVVAETPVNQDASAIYSRYYPLYQKIYGSLRDDFDTITAIVQQTTAADA